MSHSEPQNFAPVAIVTLNRQEHLQKCVESLAACKYADRTELFIALDFPKFDRHRPGYEKVKTYLPAITGFKQVHIIEREENYGPVRNNFSLREEVYARFDRMIGTEDDNVFASSFLEYMNLALERYKDREDIWAVTGYNDWVKLPDWHKDSVYLRTGSCMWGVGLWKHKYDQVDWSMDRFVEWMSKPKHIRYIKKYHLKALPQLLRMKEQKNFQGDGFLFMYLLNSGMKSVYPSLSLVRNIGHDGTGLHCGENESYMQQPIYEGLDALSFPDTLNFDQRIQARIAEQLDGKWSKRFRLKLLTYPEWIQKLGNGSLSAIQNLMKK